MWVQKRGKKYRAFERLPDRTTGRLRTFSVTMDKDNASSRKIAIQALYELADATKPVSHDTLTFGELVELYREDQRKTVSFATYKRNYHAFNNIMDILGRKTMANSLTASYIRDSFIRSDKSHTTLNEYLTRLKAMLRWAYRSDLIEDVSFLGKIKPFADRTRREKIQDKFLEADELERLLDNIKDSKWKLFAQIMVLTGMRFGELAALKVENVDLKNRYIHIKENYNSVVDEVGAPKTMDSIRDIYIQDELLELMKEAIDLADTETLFDYPSLLAFNKYIREHNPLEKNVTSHIFRHTHTSMLAAQGVPFDVIARRLGHSNSKITRQVYFHVTEKLKEKDNEMLKKISLLSL